MELPELKNSVGQLAKDTINGIRAQVMEDDFGWIVPVRELEMANG